MSGKLIVFEGTDGSGKATQSQLLFERLQREGVDCRKLDFPRVQFEKDMRDFSAGQKKKALLAKTLSTQAHLYIWDEPLNYIDVLSRIQIEELLLTCKPTTLFVEHDREFCQNVATKTVQL